jgi:hypothetical protein
MKVPTPHTPEPWEISTGAYGALRVGPAVLEHPGKARVEYALERGHDLLAQRAADAALIKAAPKMLAALRSIAAETTGFDTEDMIATIQGICRVVIIEAQGDAPPIAQQALAEGGAA